MSVLLAIVVSAFVSGFRLYQSSRETEVPSGALVYLTPVVNETRDKRLDSVTELMQAGLEQSTHINLLTAAHANDTLRVMRKPEDAPIDETTAREIAMRTGAVRVVFATISGESLHYSLSVVLQQPDDSPARFRSPQKKPGTGLKAPKRVVSSLRSFSTLCAMRMDGSGTRWENRRTI